MPKSDVTEAPNIAAALEALTSLVSRLADEVAELKKPKPPARVADPALKVGQQTTHAKVWKPQFMPDPIYTKGDQVRVRAESDLGKRLAKAGRPNPTGFVTDFAPKGLTKQGEWKYRVQLPGIGKEGILENDLEPAA